MVGAGAALIDKHHVKILDQAFVEGGQVVFRRRQARHPGTADEEEQDAPAFDLGEGQRKGDVDGPRGVVGPVVQRQGQRKAVKRRQRAGKQVQAGGRLFQRLRRCRCGQQPEGQGQGMAHGGSGHRGSAQRRS